MNLIFTQNFPVRSHTFGTTLVFLVFAWCDVADSSSDLIVINVVKSGLGDLGSIFSKFPLDLSSWCLGDGHLTRTAPLLRPYTRYASCLTGWYATLMPVCCAVMSSVTFMLQLCAKLSKPCVSFHTSSATLSSLALPHHTLHLLRLVKVCACICCMLSNVLWHEYLCVWWHNQTQQY